MLFVVHLKRKYERIVIVFHCGSEKFCNEKDLAMRQKWHKQLA